MLLLPSGNGGSDMLGLFVIHQTADHDLEELDGEMMKKREHVISEESPRKQMVFRADASKRSRFRANKPETTVGMPRFLNCFWPRAELSSI
jgi:hypothetical protein